MKIDTTAPISSISLSNVVRAANSLGRVSFPVDSSALAYANFKNISVVPSSGSGNTYSISRLRALDTLIEQLNRVKDPESRNLPRIQELKTDEMDTLISDLSDRVHTRLQSNKSFSNPMDSQGLLFNFLV